MKKIFVLSALVGLVGYSAFAGCGKYFDVFELRMVVKVPRVFDNTTSQGYRKPQANTIYGYAFVDWEDCDELGRPYWHFTTFINKNHKVGGEKVTYEVKERTEDYETPTTYVWLGSNKTGVFKTPGLTLGLHLNPSYNIGDKEHADNTMYLLISGYGNSTVYQGCRIPRTITGQVAGNQGCGCSAYSHKSPTRLITYTGYSDKVTDVAPVYGRFVMKWIKKQSRGN